jgi:mannose-6-phosphate isomerase-like protein (cupin superfamily)
MISEVTFVEKPWGYEKIFARSERYVGKILHIEAGESLSLQYHERKDETVHVLEGRLVLEVDEDGALTKKILERGEGYRILPGTRHRMSAEVTTDILEVSTPELDDVVRLEDRYGRVAPAASGEVGR